MVGENFIDIFKHNSHYNNIFLLVPQVDVAVVSPVS